MTSDNDTVNRRLQILAMRDHVADLRKAWNRECQRYMRAKGDPNRGQRMLCKAAWTAAHLTLRAMERAWYLDHFGVEMAPMASVGF